MCFPFNMCILFQPTGLDVSKTRPQKPCQLGSAAESGAASAAARHCTSTAATSATGGSFATAGQLDEANWIEKEANLLMRKNDASIKEGWIPFLSSLIIIIIHYSYTLQRQCSFPVWTPCCCGKKLRHLLRPVFFTEVSSQGGLQPSLLGWVRDSLPPLSRLGRHLELGPLDADSWIPGLDSQRRCSLRGISYCLFDPACRNGNWEYHTLENVLACCVG